MSERFVHEALDIPRVTLPDFLAIQDRFVTIAAAELDASMETDEPTSPVFAEALVVGIAHRVATIATRSDVRKSKLPRNSDRTRMLPSRCNPNALNLNPLSFFAQCLPQCPQTHHEEEQTEEHLLPGRRQMVTAVAGAYESMFHECTSVHDQNEDPDPRPEYQGTDALAAFGAWVVVCFLHESLIGTLLLVGLVTKNGILLVDYANTLRRRDGQDNARRSSPAARRASARSS